MGRAGDDANLPPKTYDFDADGLLVGSTNPLGGTTTLVREIFDSASYTVAGEQVELGAGFQVTKQSGPETRRFVLADADADGVRRRITAERIGAPDEVATLREDGPWQTRVLHPDGTERITAREPDTVWGSLVGRTSATEIHVPWIDGGTRSTHVTTTRITEAADPDRPWRLSSESQQVTLLDPQDEAASPTWTTTNDYEAGTITVVSPEGRTAQAWLESWPEGCEQPGGPACAGRRVTRVQHGVLHSTCYAYDDANGRPWQVVAVMNGCDVPEARIAQFVFEAAAHEASVVGPDGTAARVVTDASGRVERLETFADDDLGQPPLATVTLGYDAAGALQTLTTPAQQVHTFQARLAETRYTPPAAEPTIDRFDVYGRLLGTNQPGGAAPDPELDIAIEYDPVGRPVRAILPGWAIETTRDDLGRPQTLVRRPSPAGSDAVELSVLHAGAVTQAELLTLRDAQGDVELSARLEPKYADPSRPLSVSGLRIASADGAQVHAEFDVSVDRDGLPAEVHNGASGALVLSLLRDPQANHQTAALTGTLSGLVGTNRTYTPFGELAEETANVGGALALRRVYTYNDAGRVSAVIETDDQGTDTDYEYTYDARGRLENISIDGIPSGTYTYGPNGNRLTAEGAASTYDAQDRQLTSANGAVTYDHSALGQRIQRVEGATTTDYLYDALGNLLRVNRDGVPVAEYRVDALNRRVARRVELHGQSQWRYYLYQDALAPVAEFDDDGNLLSLFVYITRSHVPDLIVRGGQTYGIITDHLGSVRLVINTTTGTIAQRRSYDAWGNLLTDVTEELGFDQPFGFAGGLHEPATGLVRFGARDYDPEAGRWTAKDPIIFAGGNSNLYSYATNDPVNLLDTDGLRIKWHNHAGRLGLDPQRVERMVIEQFANNSKLRIRFNEFLGKVGASIDDVLKGDIDVDVHIYPESQQGCSASITQPGGQTRWGNLFRGSFGAMSVGKAEPFAKRLGFCDDTDGFAVPDFAASG